jgi:DNA-binding transcriptional LysR family regulator
LKNLRSVDLNLLITLEALVSEANVTRAATRLGLSQPATSNALRRLRELFADELLVRTAAGMIPTERALQLQKALIPVLRGIGRVFDTSLTFEPATATRQFTVRMSDVLETLLLSDLMPRFLKLAPLSALNIVHLPPQETIDALEGDRLDIAVSMGLSHPSSIRSRVLLRDRMACVMRQGHRAASGELTVQRFLAEKHVRVSLSPTDQRFVDDILIQMSLSREIAFQTPHWTVLAPMLERTDLLSVMPETLARRLGPNLAVRPLPFASKPFDWRMYWHRRHDNNPAQLWIIDQIMIAAASARLVALT